MENYFDVPKNFMGSRAHGSVKVVRQPLESLVSAVLWCRMHEDSAVSLSSEWCVEPTHAPCVDLTTNQIHQLALCE